MTTIYLVRHAHANYQPHEMRPLSESGQKDAAMLISYLKDLSLDHAYSSPYTRAADTILPICKQKGLQIQFMEGFKERILSDQPLDDFEKAVAMLWKSPEFYFEGGESNQMAQRRVIKDFKKILMTHKDEQVIIGTHGNIMTLLMQFYDNAIDYHFWQQLKMPAVYRLTFEKMQLVEWTCITNGV